MQIAQKLKRLEENLSLLEELRKELTIQKLKENLRLEWELRYGLFESIQLLIDIGCKIVNHYNLGKPTNYRECLELLAKREFIDKERLDRYRALVGLRNLLVHEYATIDPVKLLGFLNHLDDFYAFLASASKLL